MTFTQWINDRYQDWRHGKIGHDASMNQFADWVGVSQQVMDKWLKGTTKKPRDKRMIDALVARYGGEVYDILEIDSALTDDVLDPVAALILQFPPEDRSLVRQAVLDALTELKDNPDLIHDQDQVTAILAKSIQKKTNREGANPPEVVKKGK